MLILYYIVFLLRDLSDYYGYLPELTGLLLNLFSPAECVEYMDASDRPRPLVIRTNTLKTTRKDLMDALTKRGAAVEAIDWSKVAIKVTESTVPIGATPEYLAGHYMLQSASSMNPVMALAPQPGERVLDMSAAPGGKSSYIAQMMKNSGTVIANDLKPQRQKATVANLHRLGVKNTIVCCYDGRKVPQVFKGFDRVLLDAPCSGLGIIARDQSVKLQRTVKDIQRVAHLQKELLRAAIDVVDANSPTGGFIVYSTCSISVEENEQVVNYILQKRFVKLVETGLQVGKPGLTRHMERRFHPSLTLTRRFYPHVHNMDGFYVAKFKKYRNGIRGGDDENDDSDREDKDYNSEEEIDKEDEDYDFIGVDENENNEPESDPGPEPDSEPEPAPRQKNAKKVKIDEQQPKAKKVKRDSQEPKQVEAVELDHNTKVRKNNHEAELDLEGQNEEIGDINISKHDISSSDVLQEDLDVMEKRKSKNKKSRKIELSDEEVVDAKKPLEYTAVGIKKRKPLRALVRTTEFFICYDIYDYCAGVQEPKEVNETEGNTVSV